MVFKKPKKKKKILVADNLGIEKYNNFKTYPECSFN